MAPRKSAKITGYPINTFVQIAASGGQSGDWWQRVALTGTSQVLRSYHHTVIQVINPGTGELTQLPWRTEWLEVLPEEEQPEEVEALQRAIVRAELDYSNSVLEQEQSLGNESDIPDQSISLEQQEQTMEDELSLQSESSESKAVVEVAEELTQEEATDRHRLEIKVERAFSEAGVALRELRDRRLYRSTHRTFEDYCRDRFGYSRISAHYKITASEVVENLLTKSEQIELASSSEDLLTKNEQILPTKETQIRPLAKLEPELQRQVWKQAVEAAGGKVPSERIVKGIVERLKERDTTPPPIPYREGDVVLIRGLGNPDLRKFDGHWALAQGINEYTVTVALGGKDVSVKPQFLEEVDPKYWADIKAVHERIARLQQYDLDLMDEAGLEVLRRRTCFTPRQMLLERMEQDYAQAWDSFAIRNNGKSQ